MAGGGAAACKKEGESMNTVEPIRDTVLVEAIAKDLKKKNPRNYIMFCIGIYSGLRVSDILKLTVRAVKGRDTIQIVEKKTGYHKTYPVPVPLRRALAEYCKGKALDDYLIANPRTGLPLGRVQAWRIINAAGTKFGLKYIGTHTMRKTFGFHFYQKYGDVVMLMTIFGHTSEAYTLRYIGVNKAMINDAILKFKVFKI